MPNEVSDRVKKWIKDLEFAIGFFPIREGELLELLFDMRKFLEGENK